MAPTGFAHSSEMRNACILRMARGWNNGKIRADLIKSFPGERIPIARTLREWRKEVVDTAKLTPELVKKQRAELYLEESANTIERQRARVERLWEYEDQMDEAEFGGMETRFKYDVILKSEKALADNRSTYIRTVTPRGAPTFDQRTINFNLWSKNPKEIQVDDSNAGNTDIIDAEFVEPDEGSGVRGSELPAALEAETSS